MIYFIKLFIIFVHTNSINKRRQNIMMSKEAMIIAILVALIILWITETLGMHKTSRILAGAIDLGFAVLR